MTAARRGPLVGPTSRGSINCDFARSHLRGVTGDPRGRWVDPALPDIGSKEVLEQPRPGLGDPNLARCAHPIQEAQTVAKTRTSIFT